MTERPLSDMETDGVYFETRPVKKTYICAYSGLPSPEAYDQDSA